MRNEVIALACLLSACGGAPAGNAASDAPAIEITNVWAQPMTADRKSAAIYMTFRTTCPTIDVLRSVGASAPHQASLHGSTTVDGTRQMTAVSSIPIQCGTPVALKPTDRHVMLSGLTKPLAIGDKLPVTLRFRDAGDVAVTAEVTSMAVLEDSGPMHGHMNHNTAGGNSMDHPSAK